MQAIIVHQPNADVRDLRRVLLGAGYYCAAGDCVGADELPIRLARGQTSLLAIKIDDPGSFEVDELKRSWALSPAPKVAVARSGDGQVAQIAEELGVVELIDVDRLEQELVAALDRMRSRGMYPAERGCVISVIAPLAGSGGLTVAANLADALAQQRSDSVALLEFSRSGGKLALMLDVTPAHSAARVCQRWRELDQASLRSGLTQRGERMWLLTNEVDVPGNASICKDSARRIAILSRVAHSFTVAALDGELNEAALELMRLSDRVVLVMRPDVPSVRRARWACETIAASGVPRDRLRPVVNRKGQRGELPIDRIEASLGLKVAETIPDDPALANRAANEGKLLSELGKSKIGKQFAALASLLEKEVAAAHR